MHSAFRYSDKTLLRVLQCELMDSVKPLERTSESTAKPVAESPPAMPENKALLLFLSFAFSSTSISSLLKLLSLANLHHVLPITERRWATTSPLPALSPAGILAALTSIGDVSIP